MGRFCFESINKLAFCTRSLSRFTNYYGNDWCRVGTRFCASAKKQAPKMASLRDILRPFLILNLHNDRVLSGNLSVDSKQKRPIRDALPLI